METLEALQQEGSSISFIVYQTEAGENGTPHIQGYVEFKERCRLSQARNYLGGHAHVEVRQGTPEQAVEYCTKQDTRTEGPSARFGTLSQRRARVGAGPRSKRDTKVIQIYEDIKAGENGSTLLSKHGTLFLQYSRALYNLRAHEALRRNWVTRGTVLYGPTGTGKSKWCFEADSSGYWKSRGQWWCGYADNDTVVIDDFYGWLPYDLMLRLLDRYPLLLEIKGGQVNFVGKDIYITSNRKPEEWWKNINDISALVRRIQKWIYMPELGVVHTFDNYTDFIEATTEQIRFNA